MNFVHFKVWPWLLQIFAQTKPWRATSDLLACDIHIWFFWGSDAKWHYHLVIRPWGCFSLPGFCVISPNSAVMLHRITGSSSGTGIIQAHDFSRTGWRSRCSKCHVPIADLRQGYVRVVLDTLPVWSGRDGAEKKVAFLIFPPPYFSYANMNSTSSRVLYFCPVFPLFPPLAARLCWSLHVLPWGGKNLIFFNFFF